MKKTFIKIRGVTLRAFACSVALIALMAFVLPQAAQANMAANTKIINSATASYNDGTGTITTDPSTVTVTVTLVPAAPGAAVKVGEENKNSTYAGPNANPITNTFTVTAASNGPDTYELTAGITVGSQQNNNSSGTLGAITPAGPITLGATITVGISTVNALTVPTDGTADNKINEIKAGDTIVIDISGTDYVRTVGAVADTGSGMQSIPVTVPLPSAPASATLVRERQEVTVIANCGTIDQNGQSIVMTKTLTATSQTDTNLKGTSGLATDTWTNGLVVFKKYVRNIDILAACSTGNTVPFDSKTYCDAGVTGTPGQTLEYLMVIENTGTGSVSAAVVNDTVPVDYVNWVAGSIVYWDETNGSHSVSDTSGNDNGNFTSPTLKVNVGGVTPPIDTGLGGTIAAAATVHVTYRVAIK